MTQPKDNPPDCFGKLDIVFPMGDNGLRHTPAACFACPHKTDCLRTGLRGRSGLNVHEEHIDRSYEAGMISFVERWSRKKAIDRRKNLCKASRFKWRLLRRKSSKNDLS